MPFAETGEVRLNYRFDGPEKAPVILLSNSLGTNLSMWDPQATVLCEKFGVLRYDTRPWSSLNPAAPSSSSRSAYSSESMSYTHMTRASWPVTG